MLRVKQSMLTGRLEHVVRGGHLLNPITETPHAPLLYRPGYFIDCRYRLALICTQPHLIT